MHPVIQIQNLSKMYRLGVIGTGTISHDLNRWWSKVRGKEDPYLKIGESNKGNQKSTSGYVWALKDINLEVKQGEVFGIIGKNGAGKSTLLKILSKVTGPTTGSIKFKGRIGSLLEVGTGFHPELTGRENIFLNGAILGMTKTEIRRKLDEIIDFAGVAKYVDTPVKRYSSGMKVRLGFAVAAHLEPEILVVDEVLAVGDMEFQKKAIDKMKDVSRNDGRTILFVSHNMASIQSLCTKCMVLNNGSTLEVGETKNMVDLYLQSNIQDNQQLLKDRIIKENDIAIITNIRNIDSFYNPRSIILSGQDLFIETEIISNKNIKTGVFLDVGIDNSSGEKLAYLSNEVINKEIHLNKGKNRFLIKVPKFPFLSGTYFLSFRLRINSEVLDWIQQSFSFEVESGDFYNTGKLNFTSKARFLVEFDIQKT